MNESTTRLREIIANANAGALLPELSDVDLSETEEVRIDERTIFGKESHRLKTYLAILPMRTMRDFTDTDTGVYKSHDAVDAIVRLAESEKDLRIRIRAQIRRALKSSRWQYHSPIEKVWTCIYCGGTIHNDAAGIARRGHLETHVGCLPVEVDDGLPFGGEHIEVARGHLLGCLCGLVGGGSWSTHVWFFREELDDSQFEALEAEIVSNGNALAFFRTFNWDYDLRKGQLKWS